MNVLVVGAGIAGAVTARRLAEENGHHVLIVEKRDHIGGYCYDYRSEEGILVHKYGPHIFRTQSKKVWDYLSRFTQWHDYQHKVLANVNGHFYPMPINLDTVNRFLGTNYSSKEAEEFFARSRTASGTIHSVKDVIESQIGPEFYHAFFEGYTEKQWGAPCEQLPAEIVARIPIRSGRDDRYFIHKYQAMPKDGYTQMIRRILDHPNIHVLLNTDYRQIKDLGGFSHIYCSAPIDEYYDYRYGRLPYRGVRFEFFTLPCKQYQPVAVVNYPNNYDYTRITEFKHFYINNTKNTVIAKEYPGGGTLEPSYPIPTEENKELYQKYSRLADEATTFIGRLGEYRYYSIDQIVESILGMELV